MSVKVAGQDGCARIIMAGLGRADGTPGDGERVSIVLACGATVFALGLVSILEADGSVGDIRFEQDLGVVASGIAAMARPIVVLQEPIQHRDLLSLRAKRENFGLLVLAASGSSLLASFLGTVGARVVLPGMTVGEVRAEIHQASIASLLTKREREVYEQLQGKARNAEIAHELDVSIETVRAHAKQIYRKLGVSGRSELV